MSRKDLYVIAEHAVGFSGIGWRAEVHPRTHPVNELEFDVIIGADGRRNTLSGKNSTSYNMKIENVLSKSLVLVLT